MNTRTEKFRPASRPMPWWVRKAHRWIGLAMALQFLAWTVSGFYFALFPIEEIRGTHLVDDEPQIAARQIQGLADTSGLLATLADSNQPLQSLQLKSGVKGLFWEVEHEHGSHYIDADTGVELPALSRGQALALAESLVDAMPLGAQWLTEAEAGGEYRGRPLPAWRVDFDQPEQLHLYLHGQTGEVTAARNQRWRIFDFLWMLHILDFENRSDFNTWLLKIMAALGVITVVSGFLLWVVSTRRLGLGRN